MSNWFKRRSPLAKDFIAIIGGFLAGAIVYFGFVFVASRRWADIFLSPKTPLDWMKVIAIMVGGALSFVGPFALGGGVLERYLFGSEEEEAESS